ncbi:hypothetical protein CB1_000743013 [Camelus ferus]|nr:hypothetical protein CB1_000743013 [Camelus ferus]
MAAVTPALLCLGALSFLRDPSSPMAAFMSFQGHYFITAFLEKSSTEKPHFRPYVSPPPKGPHSAPQGQC